MIEKSDRLLVIGGSGFIGGRLVAAAQAAGHNVAYTYFNHSLELLKVLAYRVALHQEDHSLEMCLNDFRPEVVIYNAVPPFVYAEGEDLHRKISVEGVQRTLDLLRKIAPEALFVYVSTNMVFGSGRGPYKENDLPDPELRHDPYRAYGLTKAAGEKVTLEQWPNALVARTCVVYGLDLAGKLYPRVAGQVETLQAGKTLVRFRDRFMSPTLVDNFVEAMLEVIAPSFQYRGILHLAGSERVSDYQFACYLARQLGFDEKLVATESINDSPAMKGSPPDTSLEVAFTQSLLRTPLLDVRAQLARLFATS